MIEVLGLSLPVFINFTCIMTGLDRLHDPGAPPPELGIRAGRWCCTALSLTSPTASSSLLLPLKSLSGLLIGIAIMVTIGLLSFREKQAFKMVRISVALHLRTQRALRLEGAQAWIGPEKAGRQHTQRGWNKPRQPACKSRAGA